MNFKAGVRNTNLVSLTYKTEKNKFDARLLHHGVGVSNFALSAFNFSVEVTYLNQVFLKIKIAFWEYECTPKSNFNSFFKELS
ncbi:MAG: hypothetical protein WCH34_06940 [Bacteroidota bacterium]